MTVVQDRLLVGRKLASLREKLYGLKSLAEQKTNYENQRAEAAANALPDLIEVDGYNGSGVRFEYGGKELAAIACQPDAGKVWDVPALTIYLKENGLWSKATSTQVDPKKLAALMEVDEALAKALEQFQNDAEPAKPYVKFVNPKPDSK